MAARRKQSLIDDFIDLTARLPWWLGLLIAAGSYFLLHHFAMRELPQATDIRSAFSGQLLFKRFAELTQFAFPIAFAFGAMISATKRTQSKRESVKTGSKGQKWTAVGDDAPPASISAAGSASAPACPKCGSPMVTRVARQGANVGQSFWGCSQYPKCQGTRAAARQP